MADNIPLFISYVVSLLVMVGLPVFLAFFVTRYFKVSWWVVLTGVLTFLASQAIHYPAVIGINALFNNGILPIPTDKWVPIINGVIGGLLAGICEETARWVGFRLLNKKAERYGSAFALGAGHGGMESILLAVLGTGATLFTVLFYNAGAQIAKGVSTNEIQYMLYQIDMFWTTPWYNGLLPGVERIIALSLQIVLSTMVWRAVVDRSFTWFLLAVLYHAVVDALAVYLSGIGWGYWAIEGVLAVFLVLNVYMLYRFWKEEKEIDEEMDLLDDEEGESDENDLDDEDEDDLDDDDVEDEDYDDDDDEDEDDYDKKVAGMEEDPR
jgi:uncharacterized membrane protein YhfC